MVERPGRMVEAVVDHAGADGPGATPVQPVEGSGVHWATRKLRVEAEDCPGAAYDAKVGSCSTSGTVTLAADLDRPRPDGFQDFVTVHELLHLRVPNHGRLFKALMTAHIPNWRVLFSKSRLSRPGL